MRRVDVASGGAAALFGAAAYALTLPFPEMADGHPGPALFPRLLAGLLVVFGAGLVVQGARAPADAAEADTGRAETDGAGLLNAALVVLAVVGYLLFVERLGFVVTLALIEGALMLRLGVRPALAVAVAIGLALAIYLIFARLLLVPLPRGPLGF